MPPAKRSGVRVLQHFLDWLRYDIIKKTFPIKNHSTLATLAMYKWIKDFLKATEFEKTEMVNEMKDLQQEAEKMDFLHHSRPIGGDDDEDI